MLNSSETAALTHLKTSAIRWIASHGLGVPEAEDVFQQSLLKAIAFPDSVEKPEKLTSWFYQIIRNTLIDELRKQKLHQNKLNEWAADIQPTLDASTEEGICGCVSHIMQDLPEQERSILQKHFFDGKSFSQLAEEFHQSEGSIRVQAHRARLKLKNMFQACCNITRFDELHRCDCD